MARTTRKEKNNPLPVPMAFVASGQALRIESFHDSAMVSLQRQPWQKRALSYYEQQGHVHYAATYIGNALARIRLVAAKRNLSKPDQPPKEVKDGPVASAVARLASPTAGQRGLLRNLAKNLFLTGECWVVGTDNPLTGQMWEALSIDEITVLAGTEGIYRRRLPGASPEKIAEDALTLRIWQESPRYSQLADCAMQAVLDLVEKVMLLNRAEKAAARSRFAGSGILAIPTELIPPVKQQQGRTPEPVDGNPLAKQISEAMVAAYGDEGHPASIVPVMLFGPAEVIGKINYISLDRPMDKTIRASIDDAIKQIAHGLDLPQEILLGTGGSNHWSAWAIREDVFQAHLQPVIEIICDALTRVYLKPALARAGVVDEDEEFIIWYDPSQLIIRPDKGDKAIALYDRGLLSPAATRHESGFTEADAPTEEEYARWVGVKLVDAKMAIEGVPDEKPTPEMQTELQKDVATHQNELAKDLATHQAELQKSVAAAAPKPKAAGSATNPKAQTAK